MRHRALRTIGALTVLLVVGAMALIQILPGDGDPSSLELNAHDPGSSGTDVPSLSTAPANSNFTYRVGVLSGVTTDNFWAFYGREASVWNAYILGPTKPALYALDPASGTLDSEFATALATPAVQDEQWSVVVRLNESMAWSDGLPITAFDVVYTFDTVRDLGLGGSWASAYPETVASMTAESPFELRIFFTERPTLAVWPHAAGLAPIMPAHFWEQATSGTTEEDLYALSGEGDVGGGPLTLSSIGDDTIVSTVNAGYPFGNKPDSVVYTIFETEDAAVDALGNGTIDSILSPHGLTTNNSQLASTYPAVSVDLSPANGVRYLGFNLTKEPMSDQAFRTALALLLDREALARSIPDMASAAYSFVSPANQVWFDQGAAQMASEHYVGTLEERLDSAVDTLQDAGYKWSKKPTVSNDGSVAPGRGLRIRGEAPQPLTILTPGDLYDPYRPVYAAEIAKALNWLGFDVRPVETDFESVVDLTFEPGEDKTFDYDMYLLGWTLGNPALPGYYRSLFASDGELNNTGYDSEVFAQQLARYENSYTFEEAKQALWEMEATLTEDLPYLLLYSRQISEAYRTDRVSFGMVGTLGGLQARLGAIVDVTPVG